MLKVTARPEEAVALTANGASPTDLSARVPKVIVWVRMTAVEGTRVAAGVWRTFTTCEARTVTVPVAPVRVTGLPLIVAGPETMLKVTARPEEAVALTANGASPTVLSGSAPKVIVCASLPTPKD